nr:T9SS type A sorting domain-containing protein [Bacteroidota bacterium]
NGSHLSMLHGSPFSMGIAHDTAKVHWVFDGFREEIVRYDFGKDHGPGYHNHSHGKVHRYSEVAVKREANIPSHMVLDKATGWLYISEPFNSRILRMNTKTGNKKRDIPLINEPLAEHWEIENVTWEVYIDSGLVKPSGIDFANGRLIVSDHSNGEIIVYNTLLANAIEMGRIQTNKTGIMGLKIGTDGKIWFVSNTSNEVIQINHAPVELDAAIQDISSIGNDVCQSTITPVITLKNNGTDVLTSVTINYSVNGLNSNTMVWNGSLAYNATEAVALPAVNVTTGKHKLLVSTSAPNANVDMNNMNDQKEIIFIAYTNTLNFPFNEDFEGSVFPPEGWAYLNPDHWDIKMNNSLFADHKWVKTSGIGGFAQSNSSAKMQNFTNVNINGQEDGLVLPSIDFSNAVAPLLLDFNFAYAQLMSSRSDRLIVSISDDCGETWKTLFSKAGSQLSTATIQATEFVPDSADWKLESLDISDYIGKDNVKIKFMSRSARGNNLYIDDIAISDNTTGIIAQQKQQFKLELYPNPNNGHFMIELKETGNLELLNENKINIQVLNFSGQVIYTEQMGNTSRKQISLDNAPAGIYFMRIQIGNEIMSRKFIIP